jgi:hypothetical protein
MKPGRLILATVLAMVALFPGAPAQAQGDAKARLEQELQRTAEIIQRAADLARDAGNAQAVELVKKAMELQAGAMESFRNGRYLVSASQTKMARELALRALGLLLRPEERTERVELELQRTDDMLASAHDEASPDWPENTRALLAGAARQQEQAWQYYRAGQLRPALRLTLQVREQLRRLDLHLADGLPEQLRARFERTEELVRRASEEAARSGENQRMALAERAREMLGRAREKLADVRPRPAMQHLQQAERLAEQSLRLAGESAPPDDFEAVVARYEARLAMLEGRLAEYPSREASRLMEESHEHFRLARDLTGRAGDAGDNNRERAMAEMRIAIRLLERAAELVQ